jgi:hypothetical protein
MATTVDKQTVEYVLSVLIQLEEDKKWNRSNSNDEKR